MELFCSLEPGAVILEESVPTRSRFVGVYRGQLMLSSESPISTRIRRIAATGGDAGDRPVPIVIRKYKLSVGEEDLVRELTRMELPLVHDLLKLSHPNLLACYGVAVDIGVMVCYESASDGSLEDTLRASPGRSRARLLQFGAQIARAMEHLHGRHIVHRQLTAQHCYVTDGVLVKVGHYGFETAFSNAMHLADRTTRITTPVRWAAPEARNGKYSSASDVWAFGVTLWQILTGERDSKGGGKAYVGVECVVSIWPV
jgi:serine/threonine protein kinase